MQPNFNEALEILNNSTILLSQDEICHKTKLMALTIDNDITDEIPLFLIIMKGGIFFAAELLKHIKSPVIVDYIHASRYCNETSGSDHITWYYKPPIETLKGKTVYIIDDILDHGHTLDEVKRFLIQSEVKSCKIAVLVDKNIGKIKPIAADYTGISVPNRYIFGFGMDIYGLYRQLPDIYVYNQ